MLYFLILTKNINCINICIFISLNLQNQLKKKYIKKLLL